MKNKVFSGSIVIGSLLFLTACGQSSQTTGNGGSVSQKNPTPSTKIVKVGVDVGFVPFEFEQGNKLVGFEIDLISDAAHRLGDKVEWVPTPWSGLFAGLLVNKFEVGAAGITITPQREQQFNFTSPYYDSDQALTVSVGSGIHSLHDLRGKVVGVDSGSTADNWAQVNQAKYGFKEIKRYNNFDDSMMDLQAGRIGGVIGDMPAALYYAKDKPNLKVIERIPTHEQFGLVFNKNDKLRNQFDQAINSMKKDGTMAEIYTKWFGQKPPSGSSTITVQPIPKN